MSCPHQRVELLSAIYCRLWRSVTGIGGSYVLGTVLTVPKIFLPLSEFSCFPEKRKLRCCAKCASVRWRQVFAFMGRKYHLFIEYT